MVYISGDGVIDGRSPWGISRLIAFFWGIVNVVVLFLQTLFQPDLSRRGRGYSSSYGLSSGRHDPPGPPRRRIGRIGNSMDCSSAPMGGG